MENRKMTAVCPSCGGLNRVRTDKPAQEARCGKCKAALFHGHPVEANEGTFDRFISKGDAPVLVDFTAAWCGPCRTLAPVIAEYTKITEPKTRVLKVDVDKHPRLAQRFGVRGVPTLILFKGGREVSRRSGTLNLSALRAFVGI